MKAFTRPIASVLKKNFSSQAATKASSTKSVNGELKIGTAPNGALVATVENGSPVSRIALVFNAGSRYETYDNMGVTHYIRQLAAQSTMRSTGFAVTRNIEHLGGNLTCTTNREQVFYSLEILRNEAEAALQFLDYVANMPAFKPWEVSDIKTKIELDNEILHQTLNDRVTEMVHKAAYRHGLGNSLYIGQERVGKINSADLDAFHKAHYIMENAVVVGMGVDHDLLINNVRNFHFPKGPAPEVMKTKYYGGEMREEIGGDLAFVTCVTEGLGLSSSDMMPLSLLQHIIGVAPSVKYSSNQISKLYKAASSVATSPFAVSCINCNYSDSGLFGVSMVSGAKDAGSILKSVFGVMNQAAKGKITEDDLQRAKQHLKASLHFYNENASENLEWFGIEILLTKQFLKQDQLDAAIDRITLDEVVAVAKKVITGKPSVAAIGNLSNTPYLEDLFVN